MPFRKWGQNLKRIASLGRQNGGNPFIKSLLLITSVLGVKCLESRGRVGLCMIPFWICLLKAVLRALVSSHFNASIKNAEEKKNASFRDKIRT